mmetsp:Transcript_34663/g.95514  ORF Transcript_34663/g.95514 Transcript_34663/m.95514 type:complete len:142 (+) Transcript_34663:284-709(+)
MRGRPPSSAFIDCSSSDSDFANSLVCASVAPLFAHDAYAIDFSLWAAFAHCDLLGSMQTRLDRIDKSCFDIPRLNHETCSTVAPTIFHISVHAWFTDLSFYAGLHHHCFIDFRRKSWLRQMANHQWPMPKWEQVLSFRSSL